MKSGRPRKATLAAFADEMTSGAVPVDAATASLIESQGAGAHEPAPVAAAPREVAGVAAPAKAMVKEPARRGKAPGLFILALILLLMVVAGPPLFLVMSALAYPAILLVAILAVWKIFDLFQKQDVR